SPELEALTTNNTLVNEVVQTGAMDGLIAYGARKIREAMPGITSHELVIEIAFLVNARLALSLVQRFGAHVSVELHPDLASDIGRTLTFARRYYEINPEYFYVKVPLTPDGYISARKLTREGIPINFTLGFSARQNYLATRFSRPRFVNVFLGRLNSLVEENNLGKPENVGEKAALASYECVVDLRKSDKDILTQQIAASMRNGQQVVTLSGVDVLTMPPKVAQQYIALDISQSDIYRRNSEDLKLDLSTSEQVEMDMLSSLWDVDDKFVAFVDDAVKHGDQLVNGEDLIELSQQHRVNLFHKWNDDERRKLRAKGKIPDISKWPNVPVDDLMSASALEAFAKDQIALDQRIENLLQKI
ncbi:MAG TPA: transaldolase family protein, partial [Armatimonadota bacterium]|nr:transaldolase family protein [Armatimonadota bacterium]